MFDQSASVSDAAKLLDLTPQRVQQLAKENVIPKSERGRYDLLAANHAYIKYLRSKMTPSAAPRPSVTSDISTPMDIEDAKLAVERARARKLMLEVNRLEGLLIPVAEAQQGWEMLVGAFRSKMLALPDRAAPEGAGLEPLALKNLLKELISEALTELSAWTPTEQET